MSLQENAARAVYTVALLCMLPVLAGYLIWRAVRQPGYFRHWSERFLGVAVPRPRHEPKHAPFENQQHCTVLWVHAVSVGETRACAPLIAQWLEQDPAHRVVLTHTTPTGRETGRALLAEWFESHDRKSYRIVQRYLPYDLPWSNALFLDWAGPALGMLMETELWPNLLAQAKARNIPMVLANARLSLRSAKRLGNFSWLARPAIASLAGIAAQTQEDADRLASAGGLLRRPVGPSRNDIVVTGNMKFDITVPQGQLNLGNQWRTQLGSHKVFLAASTRDDEELELIKAWQQAAVQGVVQESLLLIVPRHPQRFDRVARVIESQGLTLRRRSCDWLENASGRQAGSAGSESVLLGDSLGEMFAYLQLSDLVLIGGSIPALGGQNPIEACALGRPVFFGPNMFNFSQIAHALRETGAGMPVGSYLEWLTKGEALLNNAEDLSARREAALAFTQAHRGATERCLELMSAISKAAR